ncbi:MAG TPA: 16S rRNA (cytosine(1402)-N(4))-methyltransferase RsmH [Blastocatellia bacterium]|nr:16S rRNA (cytosine(1402)-N(4))-methyltransferase RsmH [Blastocatellia bacterium]
MSSEDRETAYRHEPVLLEEVIGYLRPSGGGVFVDCTLGLGGHAEALLEASPEARVVGLDRDPEALRLAGDRLARFKERLRPMHAVFDEVAEALDRLRIDRVAGVVADLGVSSLQLDRGDRGFSFLTDAPLDMRMDQSEGLTAADLVNRTGEQELARLIFECGEERGSRKIARAIVRERERQAILTTKQLADLVVRALNVPGRWRIHPATRTFQALRIAVNDELGAVERMVPAAISRLAAGARLAIISFHSLEDRIVKRGFQREAGRCVCEPGSNRGAKWLGGIGDAQKGRDGAFEQRGRPSGDAVVCNRCGARRRVEVLTRKPVRPRQEEFERNPRSRSALLRVCERL